MYNSWTELCWNYFLHCVQRAPRGTQYLYQSWLFKKYYNYKRLIRSKKAVNSCSIIVCLRNRTTWIPTPANLFYPKKKDLLHPLQIFPSLKGKFSLRTLQRTCFLQKFPQIPQPTMRLWIHSGKYRESKWNISCFYLSFFPLDTKSSLIQHRYSKCPRSWSRAECLGIKIASYNCISGRVQVRIIQERK